MRMDTKSSMKTKIISLIKSETFRQLIIYGIIGVIGLFVDFGVYWLEVYQFGIQVELANFISSSCGLINNFLWNSSLNFKVRDHLIRRFTKYYVVGQITTLFTTVCLYVFVTLLGQNKMVVKMIATLVATMLQFGVNKKFTFSKK